MEAMDAVEPGFGALGDGSVGDGFCLAIHLNYEYL